MNQCDFLVVGAGIAGASAAYWLAPHGDVVLLEAEEQPGYHTTGRSAAVFSELYGNHVIRRLSVGSRAFFESPPDGFSEYPLLSERGAMLIGRADQMGLLEELYLEAVELVPSVRLLAADEALGQVEALRPDYVSGGLLEPEARDIDVHALHQGFLRGARAAGVSVVCNASVTEVDRVAGKWRVNAAGREFRTPVILNAAGAWAGELASLAGVEPVGLVPKRRTVIIFEPDPVPEFGDWPVVIDASEKFYFKPDAGKLLGSPADETPSRPCDAQPEELDVAIAVDRISKAVTFRIPRIERRWAGLRSFVDDKTPVVGFDENVEGFFWLAGQGGYGIQTAPALGRLAANLVRDRGIPFDLADLGLTEVALGPARLRPGKTEHARAADAPQITAERPMIDIQRN